MKKILFLLIFGFLICNFNSSLINQPVFAVNNNDVKTEEVQQEIPGVSLQTDDVLDQPVFDEKKQPNKVNQVTSKISSFVLNILGFILLSFVAIICLLFVVVAHKQHKADKRRKKLSANSNIVNAVDNFARHRINE